MPRQTAPPPSGEFRVALIKPFLGTATHTVEIIGEPNRPSTVKVSNATDSNSMEKTGQMSAADVNELMDLVQQLKGFPSSESKDIFGLNTRVELATFDIQWTNAEDDPAAEGGEVGDETKKTFKDIVDSIDAAGRQFAKQDAAI